MLMFFDTFFVWDFLQNRISSGDNNITIKPVLKASEWPYYLLQIIIISFGINLPLSIYGLYNFYYVGKEKIFFSSFMFIICTSIILFLIFINGFGLTPRFIFLFFPILIPFSAYGLFIFGDFINNTTDKITKSRFVSCFLIIYIIGNNIIWLFSSNLRSNLGLTTEDLWGV